MTGQSVRSDWFRPGRTDPAAAVRLFAIPNVGGGAVMYREWGEALPPEVAFQAVQLPGRHDRAAHTPYTRLEPLVADLAAGIRSEVDDRPFALFGHSMGALLAYRVAARIAGDGGPGPVLLGAAAWAPQGFAMPTPRQLDVSDDVLVDWLIGLGSLPEAFRGHPEVYRLLPPTRADLSVCADYSADGTMVSCPVVTYTGRADQLLPSGAIRSWAEHCPVYLGNREFTGDHFFVHRHGPAIAADLVGHLTGR